MTTTVSSRIVAASPVGGRCISVTFGDGTTKVVDVSPLLRGPVFEHLAADDDLFAQLYVDPVLHTVCWPDEVDIAPEALRSLQDVSK